MLGFTGLIFHIQAYVEVLDKNFDKIEYPELDLIPDYKETHLDEAVKTYDISELMEGIHIANEDTIASTWGPVSKEDFHASEMGTEERDKLLAEEEKDRQKKKTQMLREVARRKKVDLSKVKKGKARAKATTLTPSTPPPNQLALLDDNSTPKASTSGKSHLVQWAL
jgi:hypothetical protein